MKNLLKVIIAVAAITCVASTYAFPTLTISASTGGSVTCSDGDPCDANGATGAVTFVGTVGIWTLNVDTGLTKPATGSPTNPEMDLSYLASTRNTSASTLTITWSDNGFNGTFNMRDLLGGTQTAGMTVTDFIQVNGVTVMTLGPFTTTSYAGNTVSFITLTPTDVLTLVMVITKPGSSGTSFTSTGDKNLSSVPDGGSAVALLGIALAGIEGARRVFRARKA